jgi:hypothetical protein
MPTTKVEKGRFLRYSCVDYQRLMTRQDDEFGLLSLASILVAMLRRWSRLRNRLPTPKSRASFIVVSVLKARFSLKYCLMSVFLYWMCILGWTPEVMTRVEKFPGVVFRIRRSKSSLTRSGRPMSRFSPMTFSKNSRPRTGRLNT